MSGPARREWSTRTARDRHASAVRAALLDAAEKLFAEQGCDQTPIGQIAAQAGVARATFYVYFASRQEVFHALAHRVRDEITAVQREAGRASADPHVVVETSIRAALAVYARKARLLTVIRHQALHDPEAALLWRELTSVPTEIDARFLAGLRQDGLAAPAAPDAVVAEVITAALLHLAEQVAADPGTLDPLATDLARVYERLAGLTPR